MRFNDDSVGAFIKRSAKLFATLDAENDRCTLPHDIREALGGARVAANLLTVEDDGVRMEEEPILAPLSDEYLDTWVPRMEEVIKYDGAIGAHRDWDCWGVCPCSCDMPWSDHELCSHGNQVIRARAFLSRSDVVAYKARMASK
jgi:hypothetical protein